MSDLLQNELLSAYLDGELTAAEQARVERQLAGNTAARRFVEQMQSLRVELQELPRQTVGEDLSAAVLRIAERRMLTEGLSGGSAPSPAAPTARAGAFFRRFLVPRAMVWTGIAVAVAVMISINERWKEHPAVDKELARATAPRDEATAKQRAASQKRTRVPGPPPTMQAAPEAVVSNDKNPSAANRQAEALAEEKQKLRVENKSERMKLFAAATPPTPEAAAIGAPADQMAANAMPSATGEKSERAQSRDRALKAPAPSPTAVPAESESPADNAYKSLGKLSSPGKVAAPATRGSGMGSSDGGSAAPAKSVAPPNNAASRLAVVPPTKSEERGAMTKAAGNAPRITAKDAASTLPNVQVVYCDITPEAVRKKAFEKLLDANGVESSQYRVSADTAASRRVAAELKIKDAEIISIESTRAQTKAVLAGLAAQPDLFASVSTKTSRDEAARRLVQWFLEQQGGSSIKSDIPSSLVLREVSDKKAPVHAQAKTAESPSASPQRVLFVVRVVSAKGK